MLEDLLEGSEATNADVVVRLVDLDLGLGLGLGLGLVLMGKLKERNRKLERRNRKQGGRLESLDRGKQNASDDAG